MFQDSLKELIQRVKLRVEQATGRIQQSDDPAILDREMRFLRPFWECFSARQKLNQTRYWMSLCESIAAAPESAPGFEKTPLVWYPLRQPLCAAMKNETLANRAAIYNLLRGLDIVIFNFTTLVGRCQHILGLDDAENFELQTREPEGAGSYRIARQTLKRTDPQGNEYRIITCRFVLPNGEELKIEKDYSEHPGNPRMLLRLTSDARGTTRCRDRLSFEGTQTQLNRRDGKLTVQRI